MKATKKLCLFRHFTQFLALLLLSLCVSHCGSGGSGGTTGGPEPEPANPWALASVAQDANSRVELDSATRPMAIDQDGNTIVAGSFKGTVNFGGGPLQSAGDSDIFLAKYDSDGKHLWSKSFGDSNIQIARSVAVNTDGSLVLTGSFLGTISFEKGSQLQSGGQYDVFIAKFTSNGDYVWSKSFWNSETQLAQSIAVDTDGNLLLSGTFTGTVNFGGEQLQNTGSFDGFIAKYTLEGVNLWSKSFGDGSSQACNSVVVDTNDDSLVVVGHFEGSIDLGGGSFQSAGNYDIFLAKYDSDGKHLWSESFGNQGLAIFNSVVVDTDGNIVVTGYFENAIDLGGESKLQSAGNYDIFLAKYDSDGKHLWSKSFGDGNLQEGTSVAFDAYGNIVMTGYFEGAVDFGGGLLQSAGNSDIFLTKYDSDGKHLWSKRFGDGASQKGASVALDAHGNLLTMGIFSGTLDFSSEGDGLGSVTSAGQDLLLIRLVDTI